MYRSKFCRRCDTPCSSLCSRCRVAFYCGKQCQKADKWRHKVDCDAACLKRTCAACQTEAECKRCGSCASVWYCSVKCQRTHYAQHKPDCQAKTKDIVDLANSIWKRNNALNRISGVYYWGNVPAVDLINLTANEGIDYRNSLDLLLCGVGDPRNVILSMASLPECYTQKVTFVLNDICACTLARTVLLLYMLNKGKNRTVVEAIIQIWYSIFLSHSHFQLLTSTLRELANSNNIKELSDGVIEIPQEQFLRLQKVWRTWLEMSSWTEPWIETQRENLFREDSLSGTGIDAYVNEVPAEHKAYCKEWFASGILLPKQRRVSLVKQNITMAGNNSQSGSNEGPFKYCISPDSLPFTGWDYLSVKKFCHRDCVQEMYSKYICHVLETSKSKLLRGQIRFQVVLSDCMEMKPFLSPEVKYDRILTSNLSDYIPIGDLLLSFKPLLKQSNKCAVLVTETMNWMLNNFFSELTSFEECIMFWNVKERETALKDTKSKVIAWSNNMTSHIEYWNLTEEFESYLKASLLACDLQLAKYRTGVHLPPITELVKPYGLEFRNFLRNENSIIPFRWPLNCRRVTMINGLERTVEWVLLHESESN